MIFSILYEEYWIDGEGLFLRFASKSVSMNVHLLDDEILDMECFFIRDGSVGIGEEKCIIHTFTSYTNSTIILIDRVHSELSDPWMSRIDDSRDISCWCVFWEDEVQFSRNRLESGNLLESDFHILTKSQYLFIGYFDIECLRRYLEFMCSLWMDLPEFCEHQVIFSILSRYSRMEKWKCRSALMYDWNIAKSILEIGFDHSAKFSYAIPDRDSSKDLFCWIGLHCDIPKELLFVHIATSRYMEYLGNLEKPKSFTIFLIVTHTQKESWSE